MGWTSIYVKELEYNYKTKTYNRKSFLDREYACENSEYKWEVLKSAMVGSTWYGACRRTNKKTGEVVIFGETILTAIDKMEFFWKEVSEDMGPFTFDCPIGILNLLSPTDNSYAKQWREKCRAYQKRKKYMSTLWKRATNKAQTQYLEYTLPFDFSHKEAGYAKGDKVYLHYGQYMIRGKLTSCWTDGLYRFKKKDIDLFHCTFICTDGTEFTPVPVEEWNKIISSGYTR